MATVDVTVGGRPYQLACEDGQERHLAALAAMVDTEARALASQIGVVGEPKLLLMAALMIADKLKEAGTAPSGVSDADAQALDQAVTRLEGVIDAHASRP